MFRGPQRGPETTGSSEFCTCSVSGLVSPMHTQLSTSRKPWTASLRPAALPASPLLRSAPSLEKKDDLDTAPGRRGGWSDHPGGYRATDGRGRPPCRDAGHGEEPRPGQEGAGGSEVSCRFLRTAGNAELPNRSFPEFSIECFQTAIDCVYVKPPKAEPLGRGGRGGGSCGPLGRRAWSRQISTREGARLDSRPTPYAKTSSKHSHDLRVRAKTIKPLEKKKKR